MRNEENSIFVSFYVDCKKITYKLLTTFEGKILGDFTSKGQIMRHYDKVIQGTSFVPVQDCHDVSVTFLNDR